MIKVAFISKDYHFILDVIKKLKKDTDFQIRVFYGKSPEQMKELLKWADISWLEWCDDYAIAATRMGSQDADIDCKFIIRLHSYEIFTPMPSQVDWSKVMHLVFVSEGAKNAFMSFCKGDLPTNIVVIPNGLNIKNYTFDENKKYEKKICYLGYLNYKKGPGLLMQCFYKIHKYDPEYEFYIGGQHQDSRVQFYMNDLANKFKLELKYDGWIEDTNEWLNDKDYIINTSLFESFGITMMEGMLKGVIPLVHCWHGSEWLYPQQHIFGSSDMCVDLLKKFEKEDKNKIAYQNKLHVEEQFNIDTQVFRINELLHSTQKESLSF